MQDKMPDQPHIAPTSERRHIRPSIYDRIAPRYDRLHGRWLHRAGAPAQAALEGAVRALLTEDSRVLDIGCGTGKFARRLIAEGVPADQITLVDASANMLAATSDLPVCRLRARIDRLPFPDNQFDIVTCAWVLETLENPAAAIHELTRLVRPGGAICLVFCANLASRRVGECLLRKTISLRKTGRFLECEDIARAFAQNDRFKLAWLPCAGPAAALIAWCKATDGDH